MNTLFRAAAAVALVLSLGAAADAQSRYVAHSYHSGAVAPSTSHTVMGLSVPR